MTDYSMPVLSEQEKLVLIDNAMVFLTRVKCGNLEASKFDVYQAQIALASLTAKPVTRVNADQMHRVCLEATRHLDKYKAMAVEVNKLLMRTTPVPVKQEGEQ